MAPMASMTSADRASDTGGSSTSLMLRSLRSETLQVQERLKMEEAETISNAALQRNEYIHSPVQPISRALMIIKDHGGSSNSTHEQLLRILPMSAEDVAKTFRHAKGREAAAFGNLRRKIRLQGLRSNLGDVRRRKAEFDEHSQALLLDNRTLRAALSSETAPVPQRSRK